MARTKAGETLTEQHRQAQLTLRAAALRALLRLWPIWRGDERTFRLLVDAILPLVLRQHRSSAGLAADYFGAFRQAEHPGGRARAVLADPPDPDRVVGTLYVVTRNITRDALAAGQSPETAMQTALVRTSGTVGTLILDGGRSTLLASTDADPEALGWARVASATCCAFCAMLVSRGTVYSDEVSTFQAHDHCGCTAEPAYANSALPPNAQEFRHLWDEHARPAGAGALRAFRRALAADRGASTAAPASSQ